MEIEQENVELRTNIVENPEPSSWIRFIGNRIAANKNFLGFISGPTGSGKSWSSLSIGEQISKHLGTPFSIRNVVFSPIELMELINGGTLVRGSVIIFEESGVSLSAKEWQSRINKVINYLLQTFRHQGFILIMNSPYMDFLDSGMRKLFHAELQTVGINKNLGYVMLKPFLMQYNSHNRKTYYKYLRVNGSRIVVWKVCKPSDVLVKLYESKKTEFTTNLNMSIMMDLKADKAKKEKERDKNLKKNQELTVKEAEALKFLQQGMKKGQVAELMGVGKQRITGIFKSLERKGYDFEPIYVDGNITGYNVRV